MIGDIGGIGLMLGLSLINNDSVSKNINTNFSDKLKSKLICINKNQVDEIITKLDKVLFELEQE